MQSLPPVRPLPPKSTAAPWRSWRRVAAASLLMAITFLLLPPAASTGRAQEEIRQEEPTPATVDQSVTVIEKTFTVPPAPEARLFPQIRDRLKDTPAFLRDARMDVAVRSYYLDRTNLDGTKSEAWALGGAIAFQSGWIEDLLSVGAVFYTSQPLYAPPGRDGTNLLQPGQEGYSALGQIYGRVKLNERTYVNLGRTIYETPYLNRNDNRMTPNTFEGYAVQGTAGDAGADEVNVRYGAGYITRIKPRNAETFVSMSRQAGADVDRGVALAGGLLSYRRFSVGAVEYYSDDIINIAYGETKYTVDLPAGFEALLAAQYSDQRSVGEDLLTGSPFSTHEAGFKVELGRAGAILTAAYTNAASDASLINPWSGAPNYTSSMIQNFNRAGEQAWLTKLSYDLTRIGLDGVTAYALLSRGWTHAAAAGPAEIRETELDLNLEWRPRWDGLKGLSVRGRYGYADVDQTTTHGIVRDVRLILNYNILVF